jgi:hypothetical protein
MVDLKDIHVWRLNEADVVAAKTVEEGVSFLMKETGISKEEAFDDSYFYEFTDWADLIITNDNGNKETLQEIMEKEKEFPCLAFSYMD